MMQSQDKHDGIASVWQDKQRNYKIDYIKGILITLVVFGHSIQYGSGLTFFSEECYFDDTLFKIMVLVRKCVGKTILPLNGPFLYLYCYGNNLRLSPSILPPSAA